MDENVPDEDSLLRTLREVLEHAQGKHMLKSTVITQAQLEGYRSGMNLDEAPCPYAAGTREQRDWSRGRMLAVERYGGF